MKQFFKDLLDFLFAPAKFDVVIIDGLKYDLNTATRIGERIDHWGDLYYGGTNHEDLYVTENDRFALYGNTWTNGRFEIKAITQEEAKKWCEKFSSVAKYEELFGALPNA